MTEKTKAGLSVIMSWERLGEFTFGARDYDFRYRYIQQLEITQYYSTLPHTVCHASVWTDRICVLGK